jgi:hypothetical protein
MVFCTQASKDVKSSNIGRSLKENLPLIKAGGRLIRNLSSEDISGQGSLDLRAALVSITTCSSYCYYLTEIFEETPIKHKFLCPFLQLSLRC